MSNAGSMLLVGIVGIPVVLGGYLVLIEGVLPALPEKQQARLRPWLWMGPALLLQAAILIYPAAATLALSFRGAHSEAFVGLRNYGDALTNPAMAAAVRNNLLWLVLFTAVAVGLGLIMAILTDRAAYEAAAKTVMFMPMAISFTAASVIWKFVYAYRPPGVPQIGSLNAILGAVLHPFHPVAWLVAPAVNNLALIVVGIWVWTGFCLVIISAALKAIPPELPEAARVDGANEWEVFRGITFPILRPTIGVVATTMVIFALKAFDIVYVMTSGNFDTDVIAHRMYTEMFTFRDFGRASAIAVVLFAMTLPVVIANVHRLRTQETLP